MKNTNFISYIKYIDTSDKITFLYKGMCTTFPVELSREQLNELVKQFPHISVVQDVMFTETQHLKKIQYIGEGDIIGFKHCDHMNEFSVYFSRKNVEKLMGLFPKERQYTIQIKKKSRRNSSLEPIKKTITALSMKQAFLEVEEKYLSEQYSVTVEEDTSSVSVSTTD